MTISPINEKYINPKAAKNNTIAVTAPIQTTTVNSKELKKDSFEFSIKDKKIKINKKAAFISLAAAIAIAGGVIYALKTGKFAKLEAKFVKKEADKILDESEKVYQNAQNTISEVKDLIQKGKENNFEDVLDESGNVIRRFTPETDEDYGVMEELDKNGIVKRFTQFFTHEDSDEFGIDGIEEYAGKETNLIDIKDGNIEVDFGVEFLENGAVKIKKIFNFNEDGTLSMLNENCKVDENGAVKIKKEFMFNDPDLPGFLIWKNYKVDENGDKKAKKLFIFNEDGTLGAFAKNTKAGDESAGKIFEFNEDGKLIKTAD